MHCGPESKNGFIKWKVFKNSGARKEAVKTKEKLAKI
jgi:hypothetical protein